MYAYSFDSHSEYTGPFDTQAEAIKAAARQRSTYDGKLHIIELVFVPLINVSTLRSEIDGLNRSLNWQLENTFTPEGRAADTLIDDSDYFFEMLKGWMAEQKVLQPVPETRKTITINWLTRIKLLMGKPVL